MTTLDWRHQSHWSSRPGPFRYCDQPTRLRDEGYTEQTAAELWSHADPIGLLERLIETREETNK